MTVDAKQAVFVCFAIVFLLLSASSTAAQELEFQVESTDLQIYRDGLVRVTQTLSVNETVAAVTVPLLNASADNFVVLDENSDVLDYEVEGSNLTVFSLGATTVSLQYDTHALTKKVFDLWSLIVDTPYNITVQLPEGATVVYLSETPTSIDMEENTLALFPSQWEINYLVPLNPPAEFQISDLTVTPLEVEAGEEVTVSVKVTNVGGQTGSITVALKLNQTTEDTTTVTLEKDASGTAEFKFVKQTAGTYNIEVAGLTGELTVTESSSNGDNGGTTNGGNTDGDTSNGDGSSDRFPTELLAAALAAVAAILVAAFFLLKKREVNTEKIFKANPQLNTEEREVIQFLADNDGKVFESQIREQFPDIPRTSLWRLVKRLEKLEIVKVEKIGLENQVELKK